MPQGTLQLHTYFGPYLLQRLIAVGGMAEIYLARTKGLAGFERQLALKVVHPDFADDKAFIQMLINEAKIAVGLNHRNVVQTFDLGRIGNRYFISMEYVDGLDLFQLLKRLTERGSSMPVELAVYAVQGALSGLDYAHNKCDEQGKPLRIIHRDMSPQNILCSRQGEVKIADFGIAKAANLTGKTRAGVIKGKLVYMSPEQAWGEPVDHRTDIFSVGIVLYEALTGGSLYLEKNSTKLIEMVRRAEIQPPSHRRREVPPELDALVMRSLALRPEDRFQSAREFGAALADFLHRNAPGLTDRQLGELVERTLAGHAAGADLSVSVMARDDFAVHEHSIIFSADEMRASRPPLSATPPSAPAQKDAPPGGGQGTGARRARLLLLGDADAQPLDIDKQFIIGRSGDLRLGDARVSRRHARIYLDGEYQLEDLGSANGTFLNEEKIQRPARLRSGDIIRVGPFEMRFLLEDAPAPAPRALPVVSVPAAAGRFEGDPTPLIELDDDDVEPPPSLERRPPSPSPPEAGALELDVTDRRVQQAAELWLAVRLGEESLLLPVGDELPLSHTLLCGDSRLAGENATLVRHGEGYWLEPGRDAGAPVTLNGSAIKTRTRVHGGDTLQLGPLRIALRAGRR